MAALRASPPSELLGDPVTEVDDVAAGFRRTAGGHEAPLALPRADVLVWHAGSHVRVVVRPSGTEPELKVYLEVVLPVADDDVSAATASSAGELSRLERQLHVLLESK